MAGWMYISAAGVLFVVALAVTGVWRLAFVLFAIRPARMTVKRLGLCVTAPADIERVDTVLRSFAGGFNAMITAPTNRRWQRYCESRPVLFRPFSEEGAAMGYTLRHLFRYRAAEFEGSIVKPRPEFRYLHYVGLGFWSGMRNHDASRLSGIVDGLDPLHGKLCYDGYGFKHGFFDYPHAPECLRRFDSLEGYARSAAYQGVGRAFYFLYFARPELLITHVRSLGVHAADAAAGVGLASVFVNPDRLDVARALASELPSEWHRPVHLGMCFGLKARSINNVEQFEREMARLDEGVRGACCAAVRECDRVELLIRADGVANGYRRWRESVTDWMAEHIEYPLAGLKKVVVCDEPSSVGVKRPAEQAG